MNFEQFRAKVFNLACLDKIDTPVTKKELINEIKSYFGVVELEGIKILSEYL